MHPGAHLHGSTRHLRLARSTSRCTPSGPAASDQSTRNSPRAQAAPCTEPGVPSNASSAALRLRFHTTCFASRTAAPCSSACQSCGKALWSPRGRPSAAAAAPALPPAARGWRCSSSQRPAARAGCTEPDEDDALRVLVERRERHRVAPVLQWGGESLLACNWIGVGNAVKLHGQIDSPFRRREACRIATKSSS